MLIIYCTFANLSIFYLFFSKLDLETENSWLLKTYFFRFTSHLLLAKWLSTLEMNSRNGVQILNDAVCVSRCVNNLRKGMNRSVSPKVIIKQ